MNYPSWEEISASWRFKGRDIPMLLPDMPSFMSLPIARTREDLQGAGAVIIGAPYVANAGGQSRSQLFRKMIAKLANKDSQWNYREHSHEDSVRRTVNLWGSN